MRTCLVVIVLLAGCAGDAPDRGAGPDYGGRQLSVDEDTGIILGVVVDQAIVPLSNATVRISQGSVHVDQVATDAEGRFAVEGLEPGLYVLDAGRDGFFPLQVTAVVQAGVADPEIVKIVLERDASRARFYLQHVWEGRMACATTGANWCALPHLYAGINPASDDSVRLFWNEFMDPGRVPTHVSIDLAWSSTQTVTPELLQRITATNPEMIALGSWNHTYFSFEGGASPVHFDIDAEAIEESHLGRSMGINIETFVPTPGVAVDQEFTEFLTVFYGYAPPDDWRLPDDPSVPPP